MFDFVVAAVCVVLLLFLSLFVFGGNHNYFSLFGITYMLFLEISIFVFCWLVPAFFYSD